MTELASVESDSRRREAAPVHVRDLRSRRARLRRGGVVPPRRSAHVRSRARHSTLGNDGNWSTVSDRHRELLDAPARAPTSRAPRSFDGDRRARVVERQRRDRPRPGLGAELRRDDARRERLDRCVGPTRRRQRSAAHAEASRSRSSSGIRSATARSTSRTTTCPTGSSPQRHGWHEPASSPHRRRSTS